MATKPQLSVLEPVSNGAKEQIEYSLPYAVSVTIEGTAPILFHRWNTEAVAEKASAAKGSKAKKTDDVESYVYRCDNGNIGIPGEYLRGSILTAAKYRQDPRSPRKSAQDLYKAGVVATTILADTGNADWDGIHQSRVKVQMAAVTRSRPTLFKGWRVTFELSVLTPEYISPDTLLSVIQEAGRLIGLGDFRPSYGRFSVIRFEVVDLS